MTHIRLLALVLVTLLAPISACWAAHVGGISAGAVQLNPTTWQYDYSVSVVSGDPVDTWYLLAEDLLPQSVTVPDGWTWAANDTPFNYLVFLTGSYNGAPGDNQVTESNPLTFTIVSGYAPDDSSAITQDINWEYNDAGYVPVTAPAIPPQAPVPEAGTLALGTLGLLSLIRRRKTG